jgi:hypothetical protein
MHWVGDYVQLRRVHDRHAVEAANRGDRYLDSTMRRALVAMWLAEDDPAGALRELERATWVPQAGTFHVQHFHELIGRGEIALYTGRVEGTAPLADMFASLDRSLLMRVESVAIQTAYLRGRLAAVANDRAGVARAARILEKRKNTVAHVWAHLLRGRFDRAADVADRIGMRLTAAIARYRLAEASGTPTTDAELAMIELGVRAPARMAQLLAPRPTSGTPALPPPSGTAS